MNSKFNTIYVYTTETYRVKNWWKIGETTRDADIRIKEQDVTSTPEQLVKEFEVQVPSNVTDIDVHKALIKKGFLKTRTDKHTEWFMNVTPDVIRSTINEIVHGSFRLLSFAPRNEQQECVDKAVNWLSDNDEFLINAKMRFGKTFVSYLIAKELNVKTVLVLTYKPAVKDGWHQDLINHISFSDWNYFDDYSSYRFSKTKNKVLFASFQDINDINKVKWNGIKSEIFDLLILDEMHFGTDTERALKTINSLNASKTLFVSGTPLDALISGRFDADNTYTWSYTDEQKQRRLEEQTGWSTEIYRWLPKMHIHTFELADEVKKSTKLYSEDEQFTFGKLFSTKNGKLIDEASVKLFIDQLFGRNTHKKMSPFMTHAADHSFWMLPSDCKAADALCDLLQKIVGDEYFIMNVTGNNITKLEVVKQNIKRYAKTITVSVGRFNTGVTVPEWNTVLMLNDIKAPETYFQTIFRVQSPDKANHKEDCYVFDFNHERVLELLYTYAELTASKNNSIAETVREFLDFCPIHHHADNKMNEIDANAVTSFVSERGGYIDRFTSDYLFNKEHAVFDEHILALDGAVTGILKQLVVMDNGTSMGKTFESTGNKTLTKKEMKNALTKYMEKVKIMTKRIPSYVLYVDKTKNTEALLNTDPTDFEEHFEVPIDTLKTIMYNKFIKRDMLDRYIGAMLNES